MSQDAKRGPDDAANPQASGVDRAQIESMLDLSPTQRLRLLEDWLDGIEHLRRLAAEGGELGAAG